MAIPEGYVKIQPNTLYENVEYYIDTSVAPTSITSNINTSPYLDYSLFGASDTAMLCIVFGQAAVTGQTITFGNIDNGTWLSNVVDGVVTGYPTLNINLTTSPDWLYVKSADAALYYEPLYEGSELQDSATFTPTTSQQSLTLEQGKVAVKEVTVEAVTAAIDSNIKASNIKFGVTILGVEGNLSADKPDQTKTVTPTKSTQTVAPDSGYELSEVTVNPIPSQYIVPSGTQNITQDGTYDVTNYATVEVNVPNPLLAATDAEMTALTTEANVGKVVKFTGTTGTYQQQRLYLIKSNTTIIEFTIAGTSYTADEGMTWAEWCDSDYNTNDLYRYTESLGGSSFGAVAQSFGLGGTYTNAVIFEAGEGFVQPYEEIIENHSYILETGGGGGGAD